MKFDSTWFVPNNNGSSSPFADKLIDESDMLILSNETTVHRLARDRIRKKKKKKNNFRWKYEKSPIECCSFSFFFFSNVTSHVDSCCIFAVLFLPSSRWKWKRTSLSSTINTNTISLCEPSRKVNQRRAKGNVFFRGFQFLLFLFGNTRDTRY